jgi:sarcosine oxidase subunit alpha
MTPTERPETSALAAALARGTRVVGRSHRLHRPRGGFCARGSCQQCPLASGGLACETPAGDGRAGRAVDPLRALGLLGERMEPWFYERRLLRPRAARQPALRLLRRLSAAHRLPEEPAIALGGARTIRTEVLVAGGGPAGVAAAAVLAAAGARVLVLTRGRAGGSLPRPRALDGAVRADLRSLGAAGAQVLEGALCLGRYEQEQIFAATSPLGPIEVVAERLVVATGAYDRPLLLRGADLPGVIGLRGFESLAAQGAFGRGVRVGVFGGPTELGRALAAAAAFGVPVAWAAGPAADAPDGAEPGRRLAALEGRGRLRRVVLDGDERRPTDVLVLGFTQPTYELQLQAGMSARFVGSPSVIRAGGETALPTLVVGEAAGWVDPERARETAVAAARTWSSVETPAVELAPPTEGLRADALVCACEDVLVRDVDACLAEGFGDVELLKRRSGASTGACQGKLCLALVAETLAARGGEPALPTVRPPIRPVPIRALGARVRT